MTSAQRLAFQAKTQAAADGMRPARVRIDGGPAVACSLVFRELAVELEQGGTRAMEGIYVTVAKSLHKAEPARGRRLQIAAPGTPYDNQKYEVVTVRGQNGLRWAIEAVRSHS